MTKMPFMPLWVADYKGDTDHLTLEEHGAYLLLLMFMWNRGGAVPDDDADLARVLRCELPQWRAIKKRLRPLLIFENGEISQKRLRLEFDKKSTACDEIAKRNARAARVRWSKARGNENNDLFDATCNAPAMREQCENDASQKPETRKEKTNALFDEFWSVTRRKKDRAAALAAFARAIKKAPVEKIIASWRAHNVAWEHTEPKFIPYPATWLNKERWDDEPPTLELVRRDDDGWIVTHGSKEFDDWRRYYKRINSEKQFDFPDREGTIAKVATRFPPRD